MKKLTLTIAIVLGLSAVSFADMQKDGGLFKRGNTPQSEYGLYASRPNTEPLLPGSFNAEGDSDASSPLGSGIALLLGLGGAYLVAKKRREE